MLWKFRENIAEDLPNFEKMLQKFHGNFENLSGNQYIELGTNLEKSLLKCNTISENILWKF